ncbi:hypothetical protein FNAPI_9829 [Fusarium napiforme]|uniref:Vault poly n=1 Tax=Fusarium napiforme TaxID=42672 RepID=A0A8H5IY90_9HYPO|nr:hypothetical protein FNAPI_9829 [Fusarium napiforme]
MASRHVFTQRLRSGVIFSAPGNLMAMPEGGWGDDTPIARPKKPKRKVQGRGLDHFSHWVAKVTLGDEPSDNVDSFMPGNDTRGIGNEYRPYSLSPYPETEVEIAAKIPEVTLCLPMLSVALTATVDGTVTHTELLQKFHNSSDIIIDSAKHVFPLYDGAVITSFECTIGDERRVRGVVKPKVQARKEFEEAVRDKVAAPALLEEHTPEIFETSLGNIPSNTTVEIKITYVQELKVVMMESEATEGIALTIPMSIAPRYSKAPIEWEPASKVPEERLDIWIKVLDNGKVNHEGCDEESGHLLQFEGSKPAEYSNLSERDAAPRTYYVWHHVSEPAVLRKDFVFVVQMNEGHHVKSRAIACPADDNGLAAMMVNIRPNDLFRNAIVPQSFTGEILFLLDQSGSMGWTNGSPDYGRRHTGARKIDVMREAMLLALSGIPSTCVFNVISWGSATMGLWETSRPHTKENIREAKSYVSQVEADMGGTDLLRALESTLKRRVQDRGSTQIIILTDGELEPEDSIQFIWKKRQLFGDSIRFFALGIGDEVSHRLVESIAECGGGYSDVVHTTQTPRWHDRLNRLLKSALEPNSWRCDIDLGGSFGRKNLVDYNIGQDNTSGGDKTPYIQAPFPISSLHPFSFASISFLIDLRHGGQLPKTVTINTTTAGAKKKTYELPIEQAPGNDGTIHRLVAKSILLNLQDEIKRGTGETQIAKTNAEYIGTTYSITSKWTSFVAISENQPTQTVEEQKMVHYKALLDEIDIDELLNGVSDDGSLSSGSSGTPAVDFTMIPSEEYHRVLESASVIPGEQYRNILVPVSECEGSDDIISSRRPRVRSNSASWSRNWEDPDFSDPPAETRGVDEDFGLPTRERVQGNSSESIYADFPLYPNDSERHEAPRLDCTRADTTDDSQSDLPPPIEEYIPACHVAAGAAKPPTDESYAQEAPTPRGSESAYPEPSALEDGQPSSVGPYVPPTLPIPSGQLQRPWRNVKSTSVIVRETVGRRRKCAQADVDDEPMGPPSANRGFAIPAGIIKPGVPHESDDDGTGKRTETAEETEVVDTTDGVPQHGIAYSPMEEEFMEEGLSVYRHMRHPPAFDSRQPNLRKTTREPPAFNPYQNASCNFPIDESCQVEKPRPRSPPSDLSTRRPSPQSVTRDNIPSGPRFPDYRNPAAMIPPPPPPNEAMSATYIPLGDTYSVPYSGLTTSRSSPLRPMSSVSKFAGNPPGATSRKRKGQSDSDDDEGIQNSLDSGEEEAIQSSIHSTPDQHEFHDPLDWLFAMECQDGQGLFELTDQARRTLRLHFCQETDRKFGTEITELLGSSSAQDQEDEDMPARLLDTLMMVECYKTHCAQEEDTWDLLMERAWSAVISILGLSEKEEALEELASQLRSAMMHAHYVAATGVKNSEMDESSVGTKRCPACDAVWRTTRQFFCPFDDESGEHADEFSRWGDFWRHQVHKGHVVCPRKVID